MNTQLLAAVKAGHSWEVLHLLSQGADVNAMDNGWTALMYAASMNREATLLLLLEHGADVHLIGVSGRTALQVAKGLGHANIATILKTATMYQAPPKQEVTAENHKGTASKPATNQRSEGILPSLPAVLERFPRICGRHRNYILLDLENLVPSAEEIHRLKPECEILCFSKAQDKISVALALALQTSRRCEFVLTNATGKNALDFHIAFYLGVLSCTHPECKAYVISRDTGYDSLIEWINKHMGIAACRFSSFDSLPKDVCQPKQAQLCPSQGAEDQDSSLEENVQEAIQSLVGYKQNRPRKRQALLNALRSCFHQKLSSTALLAVLHELVAVKKCIAIDGNGNVSYMLPIAADQSKTPGALEENIRKVIADLSGRKNSRPRKRKTLMSTLKACFQPKLSDDAMAEILHNLIAVKKCVIIDKQDNVTYRHPITVGK